jgi:hypothetical protein
MASKSSAIISVWLALTLTTVAPEAHAYLDPSTGSMILSAIVGLFATAALALKTYWYKVRNFFRGKRAPEQSGTRGEEQKAASGE